MAPEQIEAWAREAGAAFDTYRHPVEPDRGDVVFEQSALARFAALVRADAQATPRMEAIVSAWSALPADLREHPAMAPLWRACFDRLPQG